jgi:hypothetical protein
MREFFEPGHDNSKAEALLRYAVDVYAPLSLQQTLDDARTDGVRKLEWGEMALAVPQEIVNLLELMYPDFTAPDRRVRSAAWRAFANSDMGRRFRTQDLRRKY